MKSCEGIDRGSWLKVEDRGFLCKRVVFTKDLLNTSSVKACLKTSKGANGFGAICEPRVNSATRVIQNSLRLCCYRQTIISLCISYEVMHKQVQAPVNQSQYAVCITC